MADVNPDAFGDHRVFTVLLACAWMFFLGACSSGLKVRSDQDPSADFSQYRTFNFFDPMGIEGGYNSPIFGQLFREAITREMTERGYVLSNTPDLIINVTIQSDDKIRIQTYSAPYMSGAYLPSPGRLLWIGRWDGCGSKHAGDRTNRGFGVHRSRGPESSSAWSGRASLWLK